MLGPQSRGNVGTPEQFLRVILLFSDFSQTRCNSHTCRLHSVLFMIPLLCNLRPQPFPSTSHFNILNVHLSLGIVFKDGNSVASSGNFLGRMFPHHHSTSFSPSKENLPYLTLPIDFDLWIVRLIQNAVPSVLVWFYRPAIVIKCTKS